MEGLPEFFSGGVGLVLMLVFFAWCVLMLFAPFFWYGTNVRTKETSQHLADIKKLLDKQNALLEQLGNKSKIE